jgi:hypothetical protein
MQKRKKYILIRRMKQVWHKVFWISYLHAENISLDHLFEAQTVAHHLNGPIDDKCKKALKTHLNAKENLAMLSAERNLSVGFSPNRSKEIGTQTTNLNFRREK